MKEHTAGISGGRNIGRRMAAVLTAALILLTAGVAAVSAAPDGFQLVETTPKDGYSRVQAQNVMVKLYFNSDVDQTASLNEDNVTFTDSKGKKVKFRIYPDQKQSNMLAVLASNDLKVDKSYKVTVSESFVNNDGDTLGTAQTIKFQTKTSGGGLVYMLLMVAMVVVMVFFTVREQRKKQEEEKGISVEEANRIIEKERKKEQKKIDKKTEKQKRREEKTERQLEALQEEYQVFHMHTRRAVKRHSDGK